MRDDAICVKPDAVAYWIIAARLGSFVRPTLIAILVAAMISSGSRESLSATITVPEPDRQGRVFVDVVGTINDGDLKTFQEKTDQIGPIGASHPKKQVIVTLTSYGGSINAALQMGDVIRKRGMSTLVSGARTCASACALIWLAGVAEPACRESVSASSREGFFFILPFPASVHARARLRKILSTLRPLEENPARRVAMDVWASSD
jgi:hypothetical protein